MKRSAIFYTALAFAIIFSACQKEAPDRPEIKVEKRTPTTVQSTSLNPFLPSGPEGGGVLPIGQMFPPNNGSKATLKRGTDWLKFNLHTTGLPAGAYTCWWVIFNNPSACGFPIPPFGANCGGDFAELGNAAAEVSIFWAAGGIVQDNGVGNFRGQVSIGDDLGEPGLQNIQGQGLLNPAGAEVHIVVKYHGPPSDDPDERYAQTHTLLGSCEANANALDFTEFGAGIQCFDPQVAIFPPQ